MDQALFYALYMHYPIISSQHPSGLGTFIIPTLQMRKLSIDHRQVEGLARDTQQGSDWTKIPPQALAPQPMLLTSMLCCLPKMLQMKSSDIYVIAFVGLHLYHSRGHISLSPEKLHLTCTLRCMKPGGSSLILSMYSLEDITGRTISPTTTWCSLKAVEIQSLISLRV